MLKQEIEEIYQGLMKKVKEKLNNKYILRRVASSIYPNEKAKHFTNAMAQKIMEDYATLYDYLDENNQKLMSLQTLNLSNLLSKNAKAELVDSFNAEILARVGEEYEIVTLALDDMKKVGKDAPKVTVLKKKSVDFTDLIVNTGKHTEFRGAKLVTVDDTYYDLTELSLLMAREDMYFLPMPRDRKDICQYYENMVFSFDAFDLIDEEEKKEVDKILLDICKEKLYDSFIKSFEKSNLVFKTWHLTVANRLKNNKTNEPEDKNKKVKISDLCEDRDLAKL